MEYNQEMGQGEQTITGDIVSVVYTNEETGYAVLEVELEDGGVITAVGIIPYPGEGESICAEGRFMLHPEYGSQFRCERVERMLPGEAGAILRYLSCGCIKGIGPATARRIVEKFGMETFDVLENEPERLAVLPGITEKRARALSAEFRTKVAIRELMSFLSSYGVEMGVVMQLYKKYGSRSRDIVTANPYFLVGEPYLVDFRKIDAMALSFGFAPTDQVRLAAGITFELFYNQNEGHVCLPYGLLMDAAARFLDLSQDLILNAAEVMCQEGTLIRCMVNGEDLCYLKGLYEAECFVAQRLHFFASRRYTPPRGADKALDEIEAALGLRFSVRQREAILQAVSSSVFVLTGGPGTGKTTAVRGMLELLDRMNAKALLAAPTGRAAKRLGELCGREAKTIHRLLEVGYNENGPCFLRNEENPLEADAVIVDELSMVDLPLMRSLLAALKNNCRLILVGDPDQLPSVGPGTVLNDILKSETVCAVHLEEIFRQAQESDIILNAHAVNRGDMPALTNNKKDFFFLNRKDNDSLVQTVAELCSNRLPKNMGIDPADIQVITPSRRQPGGVMQLNPVLQKLLNPPSETKAERLFGTTLFREGDRVMQVRNNYDLPWNRKPGQSESEGSGVFNGDIGTISKINNVAQTVTVDFVDKSCDYPFDILYELEHAYAITVHKSQGSEFKAVVLVANLTNSRLLNRNLFYTAITRAKSLLILVGNPVSVQTMVSNRKRFRRCSALCPRLLALKEGRAL